MDILSFQGTTMTLVSLPQTALTVLHSYCLLDKNDQDSQPAKCSCFMTAFSWEQPLVPQPSPKSCKTSPNPTPASFWGCSMVAHGPCSPWWQQFHKSNFDLVGVLGDLWTSGFTNIFIANETWMSELEKEVSNDEMWSGRGTRKPVPTSYGASDALNEKHCSLRWTLPWALFNFLLLIILVEYEHSIYRQNPWDSTSSRNLPAVFHLVSGGLRQKSSDIKPSVDALISDWSVVYKARRPHGSFLLSTAMMTLRWVVSSKPRQPHGQSQGRGFGGHGSLHFQSRHQLPKSRFQPIWSEGCNCCCKPSMGSCWARCGPTDALSLNLLFVSSTPSYLFSLWKWKSLSRVRHFLTPWTV